MFATECIGDECASSGQPFWGGYGTSSYKILLAVHIIAVVAAFGPPLLFSLFNREAVRRSGPSNGGDAFASLPVEISRRVSFPAFIIAVFAGIGLVLDSGSIYSFSEQWISAAFAIAMTVVLVYWFMLWPAQKRLVTATAMGATDDEAKVRDEIRSARTATSLATGLLHVCFFALVVLMVWKPGAGS